MRARGAKGVRIGVGVGGGVGVLALCRLPPIRSLASSYIVFTCFAQTFAYPIACSKQKASGLQLRLRLRLRFRLRLRL